MARSIHLRRSANVRGAAHRTIRRRRARGGAALTLALIAAPGTGGGAAAAQEMSDEMTGSIAYPVFHLGLFGNVDYTAKAPSGGQTGFRNGGLDLFVTSQLSDRWSALVEMLFETPGSTVTTDLERVQITYDHSDALRVMAGRVHSPLIRWNQTIHHGVFLQTPIDRPAMTIGEDGPGLWPVHFVGVIASGRVGRALGLSYMAGIGNGRAPVLEQVQVTSDANAHKAILAGVGLSPAGVLGLDLALTAYIDRVPDDSAAIDERDFTVSASYVAQGWEVRAEWGHMRHERGADTYETTGWYALISRRMPGEIEFLRPYIMFDRLAVPDTFDFFRSVGDRSAFIAGVRWDADPAVALKADLRSQRVRGGVREQLVRFQLAFALN